MAATSGGSLSIVKKLLAHGASLVSVDWEPIRIAIRLEHTAMVRYILGLREWTEQERQGWSKQALKQGLDSISSLLLGTS